MNRGACHQDIFRDIHDRQDFLVCLESAANRTNVEIHAYCLMGNHFHLLVRTPDANLDQMMHLLALNYVRGFILRKRLISAAAHGPMSRSLKALCHLRSIVCMQRIESRESWVRTSFNDR